MIQSSVLDQLKQIITTLQNLQKYEADVSGNDLSDAVFYSNMEDKFKEHIQEIESRTHDCAGVICNDSMHETEGPKGRQ